MLVLKYWQGDKKIQIEDQHWHPSISSGAASRKGYIQGYNKHWDLCVPDPKVKKPLYFTEWWEKEQTLFSHSSHIT